MPDDVTDHRKSLDVTIFEFQIERLFQADSEFHPTKAPKSKVVCDSGELSQLTLSTAHDLPYGFCYTVENKPVDVRMHHVPFDHDPVETRYREVVRKYYC